MIDVLSRYGGRIERVLGNRVVAVFGTPQAHEDDPERAILSALELRRRAQEYGLDVSFGIDTGPVYLGLMEPDEHHELAVMGPVANLAAQLRPAANAGEIVIGEATYRHVRRSFDLSPVPLESNGLKGTLHAYRVERKRQRLEKVRGLEEIRAELVGRDEEFGTLLSAYGELSGGTGRMVSIIGEAGVGKSRLIAELKSRAFSNSYENCAPRWLEGRCIELGATTPYWPFIDMLGQLF